MNGFNLRQKRGALRWYRIDLHMHTPASNDYQEPGVTYLDILRRAELRGLDIIAFTDHNTVNGYKALHAEVDQLTLFERLNRATPEEQRRLGEYRRLLDKILVLPGFEFTATFGFHILGIFSPKTPIRQLEHILLSLNIPAATLDEGSSIVGASSDVLTAYRAINEAGGLVVAAHVNSAHGVAMRGLDFGGQTKIAYTQDPFLHALEATDLDRRGIANTARFFDGTKPEYPRRMRVIQGSDAHRLIRDDRGDKNLGIGDRVTEIQLGEVSFEGLLEVFQSADFSRTRPYRGVEIELYDYVQLAREQGASPSAIFYEIPRREQIVNDICALANSGGGIIYIGCSADPTVAPVGCDQFGRVSDQLRGDLQSRLSPALKCSVDPVESANKVILRVTVPKGEEIPYAVEESKFYLRKGIETVLATREQLIQLIRAQSDPAQAQPSGPSSSAVVSTTSAQAARAVTPARARTERTERPEKPERMTALRPEHPARSERTTVTTARTIQRPERAEQRPERATPSAPTRAPGRPPRTPVPPPTPILMTPPPPLDLDMGEDNLIDSQPMLGSRPPREALVGLGGAPRSGVEIVGTETRKGIQHHIMRNLQNGQTVPGVTRSSARSLWQYAIIKRESQPVEAHTLSWSGDMALVRRYRRSGTVRYDLALRENGNTTQIRVFYGVTDEGLTGQWLQFASDDYPVEIDD